MKSTKSTQSTPPSKIESTWVPRAFVLLGVITIVDGCAHARRPAATSQDALVDAPIDLSVATLPRGSFPAPPNGSPPVMIPPDEKVPGIYVAELEGGPQVTGIKDRSLALAAMAAAPRDPPVESYCVQSLSDRPERRRSFPPRGAADEDVSAVKDPRLGLLGYLDRFNAGDPIHAERVDGQTLTILNAWANPTGGGLRQITRGAIPMRPIGAMAGVELFAFVDQHAKNPSVNVVVTRPSITKGRVRGAGFLATLPDGTVGGAACRHARVAFPLVRGDGSTATFIVAVESENAVRPMRVNMSALWLQSQADARITARFDWDGPESDLFPTSPSSKRPGPMRRNMGGDSF